MLSVLEFQIRCGVGAVSQVTFFFRERTDVLFGCTILQKHTNKTSAEC